MHGGDVTFVDFREGIVTLQISGSCTHCSLADLTYNKMMGSLLREEVPEVKEIIIIK
jgi:Fe-S cluster biogenesis protein NfuA